MFKVNKLTDYATVVLMDMAASAAVRPTQSISEHTGIPLPTVAKLMKHLVKAGLVTSHRGVNGGYSLSRPTEDITIADVIEAIEGRIALTTCVDTSDEHCSYEPQCPASGKWNRANIAVTEALNKLSLAEMFDDLQGGEAVDFMKPRSSDGPEEITSQQSQVS